jgi:hypothetical protein
MNGDLAPLVLQVRMIVPALPLILSDLERAVFIAPYPCQVTSATHTADQAIVADNVKSRRFSLINRGLNGLGTITVAQLTFFPDTSTQFLERPIPLVLGQQALGTGEVLTFQSTHLGPGILDPGGVVRLIVSRTDVA